MTFGFEVWVLYSLMGLLLGFLAGLLGVGGGGIMVPLLVAIFGYQGLSTDSVVHLALGTTLAVMMVSSLSSARAHASKGTVSWRVVWGMTPGIVAGSLVTTRFALRLDSQVVAWIFFLIMLASALQMIVGWSPTSKKGRFKRDELFLAGAVIGSISAVAAVGGGVLTIIYLSYRSLEMKNAIGTSAAMGFPIAAAATAGYLLNGWSQTSHVPYSVGFISLPAFLILALGSLLAAPVGATWSHRLSGIALKKLFGFVSILLGLKMVL